MRGGPLDRRIDIQRSVRTRTDSGEVIENWANLVTRWSAGYRPMPSAESGSSTQTVGEEVVEFRIRWASELAALTPLDRVVYPAGATDYRSIYNIREVHEIGRHEGFQLLTIRRADAIP